MVCRWKGAPQHFLLFLLFHAIGTSIYISEESIVGPPVSVYSVLHEVAVYSIAVSSASSFLFSTVKR